jgi:stage V sporulation protein SpoVS
MEHLATVEQVSARSAETIETADELALADAMLLEASAWVRHHSGQAWLTRETAPAVAVAITAAAASRGYMNPSGFDMERGDMTTFNRIPEYAAGTALTASEIAMLKPFNRRGGVVSVGFSNPDRPAPRGRNRHDDPRGYAPLVDAQKPFPLGIEPNLPLETQII